MISKTVALLALLLLPLNVSFWYRSHAHPVRYRFDVTLYKSLEIYLKNGVCGLHLLSMPTKTASKTEFESRLRYNPPSLQGSFFLSSTQQGPLRFTWVVFPFWAASLGLVGFGLMPVARGPAQRWWRRRCGRCLFCGYDLTGNRSGRCPECGDHFQISQPSEPVAARSVTRLRA